MHYPAPFKAITMIAFAILSLSALANSKDQDQLNYRLPNRSLAEPGHVSYLTGPNSGEALDIALNYLHAQKEALGISDRDLDDAKVQNHYSSQSGITHIYLVQQVDGIPIHNAIIGIHIAKDGSVINAGGSFINQAWKRATGVVRQTQNQVANLAAAHLGYSITSPFTVLSEADDVQRETALSDGGFAARNLGARLVYKAVNAAQLRLTWMVDIKEKGAQHHWFVSVDAEDGRILLTRDQVITDHFEGTGDNTRNHALRPPAKQSKQNTPDQYMVFAMPLEYPYDGDRSVQVDPAHPNGSPFGWHDTDGVAGAEFTFTRGNNTHSFLDRDNDDGPDQGADVDGGPTLNFTGGLVPVDLSLEPSAYSNASVVNLFYWVNSLHDVLYLYGFDEVSGNFQVNNYGNGGLGTDDVIAYSQKGADVGSFNNAFFGTPSDGSRPEMLMLEWNLTSPNRDGDFSSGIMAHEFGHGVSNRLTGGPGTVTCLNNAEQMGEGWSDFFGLVFTALDTDTGPMGRGIGTYALGQPTDGVGIRPARYSTDLAVNDYTYGSIGSLVAPHGVGFLWCSIIWEVYWALTNEYGFNPDFFADWSSGGNNLAIQLVVEGMKLQPCSPGFVDGRDAILQADLNLTGGVNQCLIWQAFAKRGLGFSADQGSSSSNNDGTEAFDIPASCDTFGVALNSANICQGTDAVYTLAVGNAWAGAVTFSATGQPAGTAVAFSPNPITTVPGTVTMTVSNTNGVAFGTSTINIVGTDGTTQDDANVTLNVFDATPTVAGLVSPTDGATDRNSSPAFTWTVGTQNQESTLEVASDAGFNNVVFTTMSSGTTATSTRLASLTSYYWRVRSANACGMSNWSATYSFTTMEQPDYFTEAFSSDYDLSNRTTYFIPDESGDFYRLCGEDATVFPTDPAGGTALDLSDDDSELVTLTNPVSLYGESYSEIYVGSNGYLTFIGPNTSFSESLALHFNQPRISGLFDDLNPSATGTESVVSYLELADRVVVTYQDVAEYNTTNSNNFQIEMWFNGDIVMTHLAMAAGDGITGLSAGGGTPSDYLASELSGAGLCTIIIIIPCPADLNGDKTVDASDREVMIDAWGSTHSHDLNDDSHLNILDVLIIEEMYGACP